MKRIQHDILAQLSFLLLSLTQDTIFTVCLFVRPCVDWGKILEFSKTFKIGFALPDEDFALALLVLA